jgi:hypothetical protein
MGLVLFDEDVNMEFMKISGRITQGLRENFGFLNSLLRNYPVLSL